MNMKQQMLKRTSIFALKIVAFVESLPRTWTLNSMGNQLLRSGTSVKLNYRAACRAKSTNDFINKVCIVEEEADESLGWLELLTESGLVKLTEEVKWLMNEASELVAIMIATLKTARSNSKKGKK